MRITCKFDTREIDRALRDFQKEIRAEMHRVGREAVAKAKEDGDYQNHTGRLRASNKYEVSDSGLRVYNDAPYAGEVEAKGYEVVSGAALHAEKRLKEIFEGPLA